MRALVVGTAGLDLVGDGGPTGVPAAGNSGCNIAVRLTRAGVDTTLVALVGPDRAGDLLRADLDRHGVRTDGLVTRPGHRTPRVFHTPTGAGRGISVRCPRCDRPRGHALTAPEPGELPDGWLADRAAGADLVVVDVPGPTALTAARAAGGLTWFEASLQECSPADAAVLAGHVDVLKTSADHAAHYGPAIEAFVATPRPGVLLVTAGADGVRVAERVPGGGIGGWAGSDPLLDRPPVDAVGAGDAFTAATAAALAAGRSVRAAVRVGLAAAVPVCLARGARGDLTDAPPLPPEPFCCGGCAG